MLNIRTVVLSIGLVVILMLTVGLVTARTELVSDTSSTPARVPEIQERPADLNDTYGASSYRSQLGECFDVPIRELAACRNASQAAIPAEDSAVDECFDVSLWEVTSCRKANQGPAP
jgi:hypothetical protein